MIGCSWGGPARVTVRCAVRRPIFADAAHRVAAATDFGRRAGPTDLGALITGQLPGLECPLDIVNVANVAALAEYHALAEQRGSAPHTMAYIKADTGVGGGIITDGLIQAGSHGLAGEPGHVPLTLDGPECPCGGRGCLALYVGPEALAEAAGFADVLRRDGPKGIPSTTGSPALHLGVKRYDSTASLVWSDSFGVSCWSGSFGVSCWSGSFGVSCWSDSFGVSCLPGSFGELCSSGSLGDSCLSGSFGEPCLSGSLGESCRCDGSSPPPQHTQYPSWRHLTQWPLTNLFSQWLCTHFFSRCPSCHHVTQWPLTYLFSQCLGTHFFTQRPSCQVHLS
ncbi:hypothetical protein GCM10020367_60560 [Streptomyces sannanensis]|uniref:ROK family protein n=1 Tax=Streptomyces sannanensis TaxID=285536 RepID=A0ABP6SKN2_9ACTN